MKQATKIMYLCCLLYKEPSYFVEQSTLNKAHVANTQENKK